MPGRERTMTVDELKRIKERARTFDKVEAGEVHVVVGMNTCGIASGARETMHAFQEGMKRLGIKGRVFQTGCIGMCFEEPLVDIIEAHKPRITYRHVDGAKAERILEEHLSGGKVVMEWAMAQFPNGGKPLEGLPLYSELPYNSKQKKIVLRKCGFIDPEDIEQYIATDGYFALAKALKEMTPEEVISEIIASGLRGRGGAGFPTGLKWKATREAKGSPKYVVCNGDEGDPGAFMDRSVLEGDPHAVLEGMLIAGYAIGAKEAYIYVRAEYPVAVKRLQKAISQAKKYGLLGDGILGTDFSFDIKIKMGAGAFVCGEETALLASIEGKRGMPRPRPPFPAQSGLWGKPTNINNVETFANVPAILLNGASWYSSFGTENSKGTKVFCITGKVKNSGLIEVPMGITLREVIFDIGGGILQDRGFKAVQTGGPSGGVLPESLLDLPVDYQELSKAGSIMGSGGLVVMDEATCMADVARYFLTFTQSESCGKCTPCREGLQRMYQILDRICQGNGRPGDIEDLEELARSVKDASLCGLGQTAPNPVLTVLRYFREEVEAHIRERRCPAGVCVALIRYEIDPEKCKACGICRKKCPVGAVEGAPKVVHRILQDKCIKCGTCLEVCPPKFSAVRKV
jgi:NADH:ubiquinone oxidoreductase subunit F (NADH-binding)/(2Fe-2S) ferredoxin/NAD-dependent dihydropyrimidine dehydrogenase PreA subunit